MDIEQIEQWIGRDVVDDAGEKVGKLTEVFYAGDRAVLGEIRSGRIARKSHLVPLEGASAARDWLRVPFGKAAIEGMGGASTEGTLSREDLETSGQHYGIAFDEDAGQIEGSKARQARLQAAAEAAERADELERQAALRAEEAEGAAAQADRAADEADRAHAAERDAAQAAAEARAEAERAAPGGPPPAG